jgi:hypothetical protein
MQATNDLEACGVFYRYLNVLTVNGKPPEAGLRAAIPAKLLV